MDARAESGRARAEYDVEARDWSLTVAPTSLLSVSRSWRDSPAARSESAAVKLAASSSKPTCRCGYLRSSGDTTSGDTPPVAPSTEVRSTQSRSSPEKKVLLAGGTQS